MIKSLAYIKNADEKTVRHASEWVVEHNLWKKRREDVLALLMDHKARGAQIHIASSLVEPLIEPFAARIGARTIGTPVKYQNGRVQPAGELVASEKKIEQVLGRLGIERIDYAYGDTLLDVPLLEHAEHPVAVYPDEKLKAAARERGWRSSAINQATNENPIAGVGPFASRVQVVKIPARLAGCLDLIQSVPYSLRESTK